MKNLGKKFLSIVVALSLVTSLSLADTVDTSEIVEKIDTATTFKEADLNYTWDDASATKVTLSDDGITVAGQGAQATGSVLTITEAGTYVLAGSLSNGQVIVNNKNANVQLVLNGASITSFDSAPIFVDGADNVYITVAEGTENYLKDANARLNSKQDAVIFAEDDITVNGTGSLVVEAFYKLGIHCENDLTVCGVNLEVNSSNSANAGHALCGEDSVRVKDAQVLLNSANDGIQSKTADEGKGNVILENASVTITSANDGIQAEHAFQVSGGTLNITAQLGDGIKAVDSVYIDGEATVNITAVESDAIRTKFVYDSVLNIENGNIQIMNGTITLNAKKDGIQASAESVDPTNATLTLDENASIKIFGGTFDITAGGDGIKATDTISILGGTIKIESSGDAVLAENGAKADKGTVNIYDGELDITALKDGIQAQTALNIVNGNIVVDTMKSSLDSDGILSIRGGTVCCNGPDDVLENVIAYGEATISNTKFIALDNADSPIPLDNEQGIVLTFDEAIQAGAVVSVRDALGNVINEITATKTAKNLFVSDPVLSANAVYSFFLNGECLGSANLTSNLLIIKENELTMPEPPANTAEPTIEPTLEPTVEPTTDPTVAPTAEPTIEPTTEPTVAPTEEPTTQFEIGDINGDNKINSKDIAALQKHITEMKLIEDAMKIYADMNLDGKINSRDIAALQRKILGN